tara:strand:- start:61 stop:330 length:270 start_codon:yes stop_codon:yes gene_type:complete
VFGLCALHPADAASMTLGHVSVTVYGVEVFPDVSTAVIDTVYELLSCIRAPPVPPVTVCDVPEAESEFVTPFAVTLTEESPTLSEADIE